MEMMKDSNELEIPVFDTLVENSTQTLIRGDEDDDEDDDDDEEGTGRKVKRQQQSSLMNFEVCGEEKSIVVSMRNPSFKRFCPDGVEDIHEEDEEDVSRV